MRILIIVSALCVLLLIGYATMGKRDALKERPDVGFDNSKLLEDAKGVPDEGSKIDTAVEKTVDKAKDAVAAISEEAKTKIETLKPKPEPSKPVENIAKNQEIELDLKPLKSKNMEKPADDKGKVNWGTLEEAQQVLIDAGNILNKDIR